LQLHDPDGVLLADGTIVHFPSQTATAKAAQLTAGQNLFVQGDLNLSDLGKLVNARALGSSAGEWAQFPKRTVAERPTGSRPTHDTTAGNIFTWLHCGFGIPI
jgi:hypothetical protein